MADTPWVTPAYKFLTERKSGERLGEFELAWNCMLTPVERDVISHFKKWQAENRGDETKWRNVCAQVVSACHSPATPQKVNSMREDALIALGYRWSDMDKRCQKISKDSDAALAILKRQIVKSARASVSGIIKSLDEATNTLVLLTGNEPRFSALLDAVHEIKMGGKEVRGLLICFAEEFRKTADAPAYKDGEERRGRRATDVLLAKVQELLDSYLGDQQEKLRSSFRSFLAALASADVLTVEVAMRALITVFQGRLDTAKDTEVLAEIKIRQQRHMETMREFPEHEKRIAARTTTLEELISEHGDRIAECSAELSGILERIAAIQNDVKAGPDITDSVALLAFAEKAKELGNALTLKEKLQAYLNKWTEPVSDAKKEIVDIAAELDAYRAYYDDARGFFSEVGTALSIPLPSQEAGDEFVPVWANPERIISDDMRETVNSWRSKEIFGYQFGFWIGTRDKLGLDNATFLEAISTSTFLDDVKTLILRGEIAFENFNTFKVAYDATRKLPIYSGGRLNSGLLLVQNEYASCAFAAKHTGKGKRAPAGA